MRTDIVDHLDLPATRKVIIVFYAKAVRYSRLQYMILCTALRNRLGFRFFWVKSVACVVAQRCLIGTNSGLHSDSEGGSCLSLRSSSKVAKV